MFNEKGLEKWFDCFWFLKKFLKVVLSGTTQGWVCPPMEALLTCQLTYMDPIPFVKSIILAMELKYFLYSQFVVIYAYKENKRK
jgi:hypothetical protein